MNNHTHQDEQAPHYQLSEHAQKNRALWEEVSDSYEQRHAESLSSENAMAWGLWRIPESELQILGEIAGKDILELGCGAARWSIALAQRGARPVGLDFSSKQLQHARRLMQEAGVDFPLIEASAEDVPLPDASFDIVFCDWGAMTFCDPERTVPEAARLLRPGGLFTFSTATPIQFLCQDMKEDQITERLLNDYFGMKRFEWEDEVNFQLPYGDWIRLFRRTGLVVEDLIETRPPEGASSTYRTEAENAWARRWPMENIWKLRRKQ
jgi:ubiquinone/menaquinone biosynthesis C-methylase UbiE